MPNPPQTDTYSVSEAATILGISRDLAYRLVKTEGHLAGVKVIKLGSRIRVPKAPLDALLRGEDVGAPPLP